MRYKLFLFGLVLVAGLLSGCGHKDEVRSLYERGKALRAEEKEEEAMCCFLAATHCSTDDEILLGRIYSNIANMCREADQHELAYRVYTEAMHHFALSGDTLAYGYALNNMAWEQAAMGHKDSAMMLVNEAVAVYPYEPLLVKVKESRAAACLFTEEYDSVLYWTKDETNDYMLTLRAQAYSFLSIEDSAAYYAHLLVSRTTDLFTLNNLYYILTHNDAEADKETIVARSSERADVQKAIELRHGRLMQAVQLVKDDQKSSGRPYRLYWLIGLIILAILLAVWAWFINHKDHLLRTEHHQIEKGRQEEIARGLQLLHEVEDIRVELAWDQYAEMCRRIDKLLHGLASKLQEQGLNEQDVRICILVFIGLSHKEVAEMLNCSPKSIGKLKDLTAKKLGVSGGQLQEKLQNIAIL